MLKDPQIYLLLLTTFALLIRIFKKEEHRQLFLILTSGLFIFIISPPALLLVLFNTALIRLARNNYRYLPKKWAFPFSALIPFAVLIYFRIASIENYYWVSLGMTFYSLKSFAMFIDTVVNKKSYSLREQLLTNMFFPCYSSGPVVYPKHFQKFEFSIKKDLIGMIRICLGIFKADFISGIFINGMITSYYGSFLSEEQAGSFHQGLAFTYLKFLYTYMNFSGYSDIAIGAGQLLGVKVPENFNLPILAHSPQEFWRRWHITLGDWVTQYLFFPLLTVYRRFKKLAGPASTFTAFLLLGLWHEISLGYFLWGVGHGVLLASNQLVKMKSMKLPRLKQFFENSGISFLCRITTVTAAAFLQTLANLHDATHIKLYILKLMGF